MPTRIINLLAILLLVIVIALSSCVPAEACEKTKGYIDHNRVVLTTKPTRSGVTTKGWVGDKRVKLTTTNGTTRGWVNGKRVTIKTKQD
jgi:hypothetical protein